MMIRRLVGRLVWRRQGSAAAAIILTLFAFLAKALSLLQQALMARLFGVSAQSDAYFIAQAVPMLIGGLLVASVSAPLTRDFVASTDTDRVSGMLLLVGVGSAVLAMLLALASIPIVSLQAQGLGVGTLRAAVSLSRLMSLMPVLYGLSGVLQAYCYAQSTFIVPAVSGIFPYIGGILGMIFLRTVAGIGGLVIGSVLGLAVQTLITAVPFLSRRPAAQGALCNAWRAARTYASGFAGSVVLVFMALAVSQLYFITDRSIASALGPGLVAAFGYATGILSLPQQLIVASASSAVLPSVSRLAANGQRAELRARVTSLIWMIAFLLTPAALLLLFGSVPVVRVLLQGRAFDEASTALTAAILRSYSLGLVGFALKDIATSILLATHQERWPAIVGLAGVVANIAVSWLLVRTAGYLGIAYATTAIFLLNAAILLAIVARTFGIPWRESLRHSGAKVAVSALGMSAAYWLTRQVHIPLAGLGRTLADFLCLGLAAAAYLAICKLLGLPELEALQARYRGWLGTRPDAT